MADTSKRFRIMTLEEMQAKHADELSTANGAERYAESKYRRGYRDGYIAAINRMWELMVDGEGDFKVAYHGLWEFTQYGKLAQWVRESRDGEHYLSYMESRPPKQSK